MAMDDNADGDLDKELRALIDFGMSEAAHEYNASDEMDEELRSLINHNFDLPKTTQEHNAMHSGGSPFSWDAMMRMDSEHYQWTSPGYNAIAKQADNQNPHQRTPPVSNVGNANMQNQINELRQMISTLVRDKRQTTERRHLNEAAQLFESSSFHQTESERSRPTSGVSTAVDETPLPFNRPGDSQGLSRRSSSTKHKSRIRIPGGYPCVKCDEKFDIPSLLRQHELTHLSYDERPFACLNCGQRFVYAKDLTRHKRQVHDLHRTSQDEPLEEDPAPPSDEQRGGPTRAENIQASEGRKGKKPPRRNNSAAARARERHAWSLRQSRPSSEQDDTNSQASSSGRRRNSGLPTERTDDQPDLLLPDPNIDLAEAIRSLEIQKSAQHKTISDLQRDLNQSKQNLEKWRSERDAFAAMLDQRLDARAKQQSTHPSDQQLRQSVEPHRLQRSQNDVNFDEFIIYTAKSPRQPDQATGHRNT